MPEESDFTAEFSEDPEAGPMDELTEIRLRNAFEAFHNCSPEEKGHLLYVLATTGRRIIFEIYQTPDGIFHESLKTEKMEINNG